MDKKCYKVIVMGASAGGVEAMKEILPGLQKPLHASVLVVLHISPDAPSLLAELFSSYTKLRVKEAESGELLLEETVYIAPANYHLSVESNGTLSLSTEEPLNFSRPSIDILFESAAMAYKSQVLGILMTGANKDGAQGLKRIAELGGTIVVHDPDEAAFPAMPLAALNLTSPDKILSLKDIRKLLSRLRGEV